MSAISRIIGLTGKSIGSGTRLAGLGVSAVITKDLAVSINKSGYIQSAAGSATSYLGGLFKPVAEAVGPHIQSLMGNAYVAPVIGGLSWAGKGLKSFGYDMSGALFGRELFNTAPIVSTVGSFFGISAATLSSIPAFTLLSGHLGALGLALPIARAGGKAVSQWMLKGQVARGLMHAYPELSREIGQDIVKAAMKQGLGVPQRVAEIAGQLAQAQLKSPGNASTTLKLLGVGGAAAGVTGLNVISSGAQSLPTPKPGFHI